MRPTTRASFTELRDAEPLVSAVFAARYFNIGRDRVPVEIRAGNFPVDVIETGVGRMCTKTAVLRALGISPQELILLAEMEGGMSGTPGDSAPV